MTDNPSTDDELMSDLPCGWCGKEPTGFASIMDVRFCHGDDDAEPTCYEQQQWEMSATGSFLLQLHPRSDLLTGDDTRNDNDGPGRARV